MADTRFENSNDNSHAFSEAEKAVIAARKRQELEEAAKLLDYQERRRVERMNEDEELRMLRAKQERRRLERKEEEEREMVEKKKEEERLRNLQEEKARKETELKMKNTEKRKQSSLISLAASTNQLIPVKSLIKTDRTDKFGNIVQAKQEMGMTKEQQEQVKRSYLTSVRNSMDLSAASSEEIKVKIKQLYQRICRLESEKYDLEKRHERQEYDLKELNERQRQVARNKFGRTNVNVISDKFAVKYPPKVAIVSKYDRQIDRRGFSERRALFENKAAFPCFPNVPPSSQNHSFIVNKILSENEDGDEENEEDEMRYGVVPSKYKNTLHMKEDENKYNDNKCKEAEKVQLSKMEVQQFISSKGKGKKKNEEVESEEDEEIDGQDEIVPMVTYIGKKTTDKWEESVDDEDEEEDEEEDDEDDEEEHEEEDEKELKITVPVTHIEARTVDEPNEVSSEDEEEEEEEDEEYHEEDEEEGEE